METNSWFGETGGGRQIGGCHSLPTGALSCRLAVRALIEECGGSNRHRGGERGRAAAFLLSSS